VRDAVAAQIKPGCRLDGLDPVDWCRQSGASGPAVRAAIGAAARKNGWFKSQTRGQRLGRLVAASLADVPAEERLKTTLDRLRAFAYEHPSDEPGEPDRSSA
jgi:hypothetical protein